MNKEWNRPLTKEEEEANIKLQDMLFGRREWEEPEAEQDKSEPCTARKNK